MVGFLFGITVILPYICTTMKTKRELKIDKFYERAFEELFRRVGFDGFQREFTEQSGWFTLREWTLEEDLAFTKWFSEEYRKTLRAPRYVAEGAARMFVFNYGWKIKKEHQTIPGFRR